jgi:hypothetical protein
MTSDNAEQARAEAIHTSKRELLNCCCPPLLVVEDVSPPEVVVPLVVPLVELLA